MSSEAAPKAIVLWRAVGGRSLTCPSQRAYDDRKFWKTLMPTDLSEVSDISVIFTTPDGKGCAYEYGRTLFDLYLVFDVK